MALLASLTTPATLLTPPTILADFSLIQPTIPVVAASFLVLSLGGFVFFGVVGFAGTGFCADGEVVFFGPGLVADCVGVGFAVALVLVFAAVPELPPVEPCAAETLPAKASLYPYGLAFSPSFVVP